MQLTNTHERTRSRKMDVDTFFNSVYNDTCTDILRLIVIRTNDADQVEDIFQNVYKAFYIRISKKGFADIRVPRAFIVRLAQKELSKHYKYKAVKQETETDLEDFSEIVEAESIPFTELMEQREAIETIQRIVKGIPLLSYKAFTLFYRYDMPVSAIARSLGISTDNVKQRLHRARNAVRKGLQGEIL